MSYDVDARDGLVAPRVGAGDRDGEAEARRRAGQRIDLAGGRGGVHQPRGRERSEPALPFWSWMSAALTVSV